MISNKDNIRILMSSNIQPNTLYMFERIHNRNLEIRKESRSAIQENRDTLIGKADS